MKVTANGTPCLLTSIALNNGKDKEGKEIPADFPNITMFNKLAENVCKYCKKGSQIAVDGKIKTRTWEKEDGTKVYETYVMVNNVEFLDTKSKETAPLPEPEYTSQKTDTSEVKNDVYEEFGAEISEEDLPF